MSDELKPCVHCGAEAEVTDNDSLRNLMWMVNCVCGCLHTCYYPTKELAIKQWNYRIKE